MNPPGGMQYAKPAVQALREWGGLCSLAFAVQVATFLVAYPGYYAPIWPDNQDHYVPVASWHSGVTVIQMLGFPRPVGTIFLRSAGAFGLYGSLAVMVALVTATCALTGVLLRRVFGVQKRFAFYASFAAYAFLIFSNPRCYFVFRWDVLASLAFALTVLAVLSFRQHGIVWKVIAFLLVLAGFLSKETYAATLAWFAFAYAVSERKRTRLAGVFACLGTVTAFVAAYLINQRAQSPFTAGPDSADAPYRVVLKPASVLSEVLRYGHDFSFNVLSAGSVLIASVGAILLLRGVSRWVPLTLILGGTLVWLPNSVLPNHHFDGYAWNAAYLVFAPVLVAPALFAHSWRGWVVGGALLSSAFASHTITDYRSNDWSQNREQDARRLLRALEGLTDQLGSERGVHRVLVTGIRGTNPFEFGSSKNMFENMRNVEVDLIAYPPRESAAVGWGVRFVTPADVDLAQYDWVWAFRVNGTIAISQRGPIQPDAFAVEVVSAKEMVLYPDLLDILRGDAKAADYLQCGGRLYEHGNHDGAERCLKKSLELDQQNPYAYYTLGLVRVEQHRFEDAAQMFERAIASDTPGNPNAAFVAARDNARKRATAH